MSPGQPTIESLQARLQELQEQNERLLANASAPRPTTVDAGPARRGRWRPIVSALCIVVASVLVPLAILGGWSRAQLTDADRFVATMGPLVGDVAVQQALVEGTTAVIDEHLDIEQTTNELFDGLQTLGLPPRAEAAIELLRGPATQGVEGLIDQVVTRLVQSEAFAETWDLALRASHRGLVAAAGGGSSGAVTVDAAGVIGIELGPIIAEVKQRLVDRGVGLAESIPEIDRTIAVAQIDQLATVRLVYGATVTTGALLPWITIGLFVLGVLVARRRSIAVLGSGVGIAAGSGLLAAALAVGPTVISVAAAERQLSGSALLAIYDQITQDVRHTATITAVIGVVTAALAWTQGGSRRASALRRGFRSLNDSIRGTLSARGFRTGALGHWMDEQRVLVRVVLCALAVIWLWLLRPLGVGETLGVVTVGLIVWWVAEILRSPRTVAVQGSPRGREDRTALPSRGSTEEVA